MMQTLALGIDIGGTNTSFGIVNRLGAIVAQGTVPTTGHTTVEQYIVALAVSLNELLRQVDMSRVVGIGVGAPNGNFYTGEILFAPNLPWKGVAIPIAKMLSVAMGLPCTLTNDANAAALGEMKYGIAKGLNDFVVVTLGTGVGSGFVANGKLVYGHDGFAGELGHVIAVRNGRSCGCGRFGCLEAYCSATGIVATANQWIAEGKYPHSILHSSQPLSALSIYNAAIAGDTLALDIFDYTALILGQTLADIVAITSPEAIIFFGGLAHSGDVLLKPVKQYLESELLNIYKNKVKILSSALPGADAAILGASALVW
jgi:glucokinase